MILKREVGIGQLTDVQTSEIDYITRMKAMPFDLYSKKVTSQNSNIYQIDWFSESCGKYWLEE